MERDDAMKVLERVCGEKGITMIIDNDLPDNYMIHSAKHSTLFISAECDATSINTAIRKYCP